MSTIDIGIAEAPALPPARAFTPNLARPTVARQAMPAPDPIHVDFYVGSTKIEALPLANTTPGTASALPAA
jgi:hypothetical protein